MTTQMKNQNGTHYRSGLTLFLSFMTRDPPKLIISVITMIASSFAALLPAVIVGSAIDILRLEGVSDAFILEALKILGAGILFYFISFFAFYTFMTLAFQFERDIRQEFFDKIQDHSLTFHDENNSSKLLAMGMTETQQMRTGIMPASRQIAQNIFSIIFVLYFINVYTDITKTVIAAFGFILYYFAAIMQAKKIVPIRKQLADTVGSLTEESQEIFQGIEVVRSLQASTNEVYKFRTTSERYADLARREGQMSAFYIPNLIIYVLTAILFALTLIDVTNGIITVGELIVVLGLLITIQLSSLMMPQMFLLLNAALTNSNRIWEKMNWHDPQPDKIIVNEPEVNWSGDILFENVTFNYGNGIKPALKEINLRIPANSKVALIGGPGSGKSTFLKLLLQLYLPTEGKILIDGTDYTDIPPTSVRKNVSRVEQEIFLFSGKISDNISFANSLASEDEIMEAASAAQAMEFIDELPNGINTVIGERGVDLSGGQKQRLAIARAILADPEILLLDDSASALDSKTEELLRKALENLSANRMTITVTQRLNTLVNADLIILLDKGILLDLGTHKELFTRCRQYKKIFELLPKSEQILAGDSL